MVQRVWDGLSSVAGWGMNVLLPIERTVTGFVGECQISRIERKLLVETWSWSVIEGPFGIGL